MKCFTVVMLTPKNAVVEKSVKADTLANAAGLACTLFRGTVLALCED